MRANTQSQPSNGKPNGGSVPPLRDFTGYEKFVVAALGFLNFTIVLDFMVLSPLGAILMPAMELSTTQFGLVVSAYAFSAGASGFLAAGFADRFDRKKLLLFFYTGFIVGTLCCAMAPNYEFLLGARIVTGIFGGIIGSIVLAITTDLFPMEMRGRVLGVIQTAFAGSQVLGIPFSLYLANNWGWHAPFLLIVGIGSAAGIVLWMYLRPIDAHLKLQGKGNPFQHLLATVTRPRYIQGFAAMALLATGGFMLMPFASAFTVNNLGVSLHDLPFVYMVTGVVAMILGPMVGRLSDRVGKYQVFATGSILLMGMVYIYTNLGTTPLWMLVLINAALYTGVSARIICSSALISGVPDAKDRGAFMSVSSSIQQVSGGLAAALGGMIVSQTDTGFLEHFPELGYAVIGASAITLVMMYGIHRQVEAEKKAPTP